MSRQRCQRSTLALPYYVLLGVAADRIGIPLRLALTGGLLLVGALALLRALDDACPILALVYPGLGAVEAQLGGRLVEAIVREAGR